MEEMEMTKKLLTSILASGLAISLVYGIALAGEGNNLPSGQRFVLNVIAFDNCPEGDFMGSNRHMIAVEADAGGCVDDGTGKPCNQAGTDKNSMVKNNTIELMPPDDEANYNKEIIVVDGNACGGNKQSAKLMLPSDVYGAYEVYARLVGKKDTEIGVTTCADEAVGYDVDGDGVISEDEILCSTESVVMYRTTGKGALKFTDVTEELLTICVEDITGANTCYPLFSPELEDYFWQWNTQGRAHAQLVFIPVSN